MADRIVAIAVPCAVTSSAIALEEYILRTRNMRATALQAW